ncbi:RNA polymerase sigma factor [Demequina sp.]|uniref:RNA polymerase sigma factor n=1 Tax=Demequina sp. TaxID=2050685 RepID=UPI0025DC368C|nr:RNA polymerase sigma factor [Demequina sp.]
MTLGPTFDSVLGAARAGEEWAWSALYRDLVGPVRGYLAGRGSPEPEDEAAETFLHIARGLHSFTGDERAFRSWVFSIAHRRMVDAYRRASRRPATVEDEAADLVLREAVPSAEQQALLREEAAAAASLLEGLTPDQRDILLLRVVGELSVRETAEIVGKSQSAVKVAQHRAIGALRRRFQARV